MDGEVISDAKHWFVKRMSAGFVVLGAFEFDWAALIWILPTSIVI